VPYFNPVYLCFDYLSSHSQLFYKLKDLKSAKGYTLSNAIMTGVVTPHLGIGCTAGDEECWELFKDLYYPVIKVYHGYDPEKEVREGRERGGERERERQRERERRGERERETEREREREERERGGEKRKRGGERETERGEERGKVRRWGMEERGWGREKREGEGGRKYR
jgi:hypothetical protein